MTNDQKEKQRALFEVEYLKHNIYLNGKSLVLNEKDGWYEDPDANIGFQYWLLALESQPKQEIIEWISVNDQLPKIGEKVILFAAGVVQKETFTFSFEGDDSEGEYYWWHEHLDYQIDLSPKQKWMPLPSAPL